MIDLSTLAALLERGYGVKCWCPGCKREAHADVAMLVRNGLADKQVKRCRPRCRKCGQLGIWSFTGPVPLRAVLAIGQDKSPTSPN